MERKDTMIGGRYKAVFVTVGNETEIQTPGVDWGGKLVLLERFGRGLSFALVKKGPGTTWTGRGSPRAYCPVRYMLFKEEYDGRDTFLVMRGTETPFRSMSGVADALDRLRQLAYKEQQEESAKKSPSEERYNDYKRGWVLGATGQPMAAAIGTPEPRFLEDYRRGFSDGNKAFKSAMEAAFNALTKSHKET